MTTHPVKEDNLIFATIFCDQKEQLQICGCKTVTSFINYFATTLAIVSRSCNTPFSIHGWTELLCYNLESYSLGYKFRLITQKRISTLMKA